VVRRCRGRFANPPRPALLAPVAEDQDEPVRRWVLRVVIGPPNSFTRVVTYWTVSVLATLPFGAIVPPLRKTPVIAYLVMGAVFLVVFQITTRLVDRWYERLNARYRVF
jgi:hypothetical protein